MAEDEIDNEILILQMGGGVLRRRCNRVHRVDICPGSGNGNRPGGMRIISFAARYPGS